MTLNFRGHCLACGNALLEDQLVEEDLETLKSVFYEKTIQGSAACCMLGVLRM